MGRNNVKDLQLLSWLTQLGFSTAIPLVGFVLLAVWLKNRFSLGNWILFAGIALGLICAVNGFYRNLKLLIGYSKDKKTKNPPVSFTEHD